MRDPLSPVKSKDAGSKKEAKGTVGLKEPPPLQPDQGNWLRDTLSPVKVKEAALKDDADYASDEESKERGPSENAGTVLTFVVSSYFQT